MRGEDGEARICVTNAKGGTGKTTVAINVAGALNERGRDVLFDALTDHRRRDVVEDLVVEHAEMDVLPSSIDLLQAETELTIADLIARIKADPELTGIDTLGGLALNVDPEGVSAPHALDALDRTLAAVDAEYDYVIIDSPPFYGKLTDTGIYAARNVLVPALTEATSERAIELLIDQVVALEGQVDITVTTVGVVANRVENTGEDRTMVEWLGEVFAGYPVWEVRKRVALQRAFSAGQSLFEYDPDVDMTEVFFDIATELDRQFGHAEVTA